jgi:predicted nucleic acid-binding protein
MSAGSLVAEGVFQGMKGIADTGFIVAVGSREDRYHRWATGVAVGVNEPLLTCESVLSEAAFHLNSSSYVLSLVEDGLLKVAFDATRHVPQLQELALRYADRRPDLADLCLIRMSEIYPQHAVVTVDESDFRVYRRNRRETIPILCPPSQLR